MGKLRAVKGAVKTARKTPPSERIAEGINKARRNPGTDLPHEVRSGPSSSYPDPHETGKAWHGGAKRRDTIKANSTRDFMYGTPAEGGDQRPRGKQGLLAKLTNTHPAKPKAWVTSDENVAREYALGTAGTKHRKGPGYRRSWMDSSYHAVETVAEQLGVEAPKKGGAVHKGLTTYAFKARPNDVSVQRRLRKRSRGYVHETSDVKDVRDGSVAWDEESNNPMFAAIKKDPTGGDEAGFFAERDLKVDKGYWVASRAKGLDMRRYEKRPVTYKDVRGAGAVTAGSGGGAYYYRNRNGKRERVRKPAPRPHVFAKQRPPIHDRA